MADCCSVHCTVQCCDVYYNEVLYSTLGHIMVVIGRCIVLYSASVLHCCTVVQFTGLLLSDSALCRMQYSPL